MLPDFLSPYKHYSEETISVVLDDVVTSEDKGFEDYPSEMTMLRWHHWLMINRLNIEGHLKSVGHRTLGFSKQLLSSGVSLLSELRRLIPDGWLRIILRYIYNSGNSLTPLY